MRLPRIAITIGDPAGVGAEIALKALSDSAMSGLAHWILIGDPAALDAAARTSGIDLAALLSEVAPAANLSDDHALAFGDLRPEYGLAAIDYVRRAVEMCLAGDADAMVTAPLNKEAVTLSGREFTGHTE